MGLRRWAKRKMARANLRALIEGRHHDRAEQKSFDEVVAASVRQHIGNAAAQETIQSAFWTIFGQGPDVTFSSDELFGAARTMTRRLFGSADPDEQKRATFRELDNMFVDSAEYVNFAKATWLVSRGNYYGDEGRLAEALSDFEEALRLQADHLPAHVSRALVYAKRGDVGRAKQLVAEMPEEMRVDGTRVGRKSDMIEILSRIAG